MSAEDEIPKWKQELFGQNIILGLQQKGSKLRSRVTVGSYKGKAAEVVKRLGATEAEDDDDRNGDTPIMNTPRESVWVAPRKFHWGDLWDDQDVQEQIVDPSSPIVQNAIMAMGRKLDRGRIIPALFADMQKGTHFGDSATAFPGDSSQDIATTVGSADEATACGMNVAKFINAYTLLIGREIDPETERLNAVMTYVQLRELMKDPLFNSDLYRDQKVFDNRGGLTNFMGFDIVIANDKAGAPRGAAGSGLPWAANVRSCAFYLSTAMHLGIWQDVVTRIQRDPTKQYKWRPYISCHAGATRTDNLAMVRVLTKEV